MYMCSNCKTILPRNDPEWLNNYGIMSNYHIRDFNKFGDCVCCTSIKNIIPSKKDIKVEYIPLSTNGKLLWKLDNND